MDPEDIQEGKEKPPFHHSKKNALKYKMSAKTVPRKIKTLHIEEKDN